MFKKLLFMSCSLLAISLLLTTIVMAMDEEEEAGAPLSAGVVSGLSSSVSATAAGASSSASLAAEIDSNIQKIETLTVALKGLNPVDFDHNEARRLVKDGHLDMTERPDAISGLYSKIEWTGSGCGVYVFRAELAQDRPQAGLKKGNVIALRVSGYNPNSLSQENPFDCSDLEALIRLSSKFKNPGCPITDFFPDFYGIYYIHTIPRSLVEGAYPENRDQSSSRHNLLRVEEMEWVDTTFERAYHDSEKVPDSVIFETLYGGWAGEFLVGIHVEDHKSRNYGLKTVNYGRCYSQLTSIRTKEVS